MSILIIAETFSTMTDQNGNRYHAARLTSLEGKSLTIAHVGGDRNLPYSLSHMGLDHSQIHTSNSTIKHRELKELYKGSPLEHQIKGALWHMLPHADAVRLLAAFICERCKWIEQGVIAENDGSLPENYRLSKERLADKGRRELADIAKDHSINMCFPGVFPCFSIDGRDWTATDEGSLAPLAEGILAQPCKFAP